jgi:hypothetical protein
MAQGIYQKKGKILFSIALTTLFISTLALSGCTQEQKQQPAPTLLTLHIGTYSRNYTLDNLTALDHATGQGAYINKAGTITGPNNFTGVTISTLIVPYSMVPQNYTVHAIASDGYSVNYTMAEANGHVTVFNETGASLGTANLTMIIAYQENGAYLNATTKGPLRIAFIGSTTNLTSAGKWLSSLTTIEILATAT